MSAPVNICRVKTQHVLTPQSRLPFQRNRAESSLVHCVAVYSIAAICVMLFKEHIEVIMNFWASARPGLRWRIWSAGKTMLILQNAKYLHLFVSEPCLGEADAALVLVKYEIISADLRLDYAHISIAKQCGWRWNSCCINSSLLRVPQ